MDSYKPKSKSQLKAWNKGKQKSNLSGFKDELDFINWYEAQEKECYYCKIKERELQKLINLGIIKSKRFPVYNEPKRGRNRGFWLEIDRKNPENIKYSRKNCVLACYFCNNDKSDIFSDTQYLVFMKKRASYLKTLLKSV